MSGDNGFCEEKQNRVMGVEDDGGRKPLFFFTKVVRQVLSKERNIIRELRGKEGVSHTDSHLVISWGIKANDQTLLGKVTDILVKEFNLETKTEA